MGWRCSYGFVCSMIEYVGVSKDEVIRRRGYEVIRFKGVMGL